MAIHPDRPSKGNSDTIIPVNRVTNKEEIHSIVDKQIPAAPKELKMLMEEVVYQIMVEHKTPMEAMGVTRKEVEQSYTEAYNDFQSGKYDEAIQIFKMLQIVDPNQYRYAFAIGAALQYQKKYLEAAGSYLIAAKLDLANPMPHYHLYDCFMKANYPQSALFSIKQAITLAGDDPQYAILKTRAELEEKHVLNLLTTMIREQEKAGSQDKKGDGV